MRSEIVGGKVAEVIVMLEESVLVVRELGAGARFTVGEGGDLPWPLAVAAPLLRVTPSGIDLYSPLAIADHLSVELLDSSSQPIRERLAFVDEIDTGARVATLPRDRRARIQLGDVTVLVGETRAAERRHLPPKLDLRAHISTGVTALGFLLGLLCLNAIPPEPSSLAIDPFALEARGVRVRFEPPVEPPSSGGQGTTAASAPAPARKTTQPKYVKVAGDMKSGTKPVASREDRKRAAEDAAAVYGMLGTIRSFQGSATGSVFGPATAFNGVEGALGELGGSLTGDAAGSAAVDRLGARTGGSGETVGLGKIGTSSRPGDGDDGGGNCRGCKLHGHTAKMGGDMTLTPPSVFGPIDKEIVRRAVRAMTNSFRFCYERELQHNSSLDGRVVTRFTIAPNGKIVASVTQSSTMNDPAVDSCVAETFRRLQLPAMPPGAGAAVVVYPLAFHSAAQGM